MTLYVQSVYIMSDKINYANCMKRRCEQCKHYDYCFRYRPKRKGEKENEKIKIYNSSNRQEHKRRI